MVVPSSQKGNDMHVQYKQLSTIFLAIVLIGNSACSTTTKRVGPSQAAMSHYGIDEGDTVLVRYVMENNPRGSSSSEYVHITSINNNGIFGVGENGDALNIGYDDIFQIEVQKKSSAMKSDNRVLMGASNAIEGAAKLVPTVACIALALNGVSCW